MSVARTMKKLKYDLKVLEEAAKRAGMNVSRDNRGDLMIVSKKSWHPMTFKEAKDGTVNMTFDDDYAIPVRKTMAHEILPRYIEVMAERGTRGRFTIKSQKKIGSMTQVRIGVR